MNASYKTLLLLIRYNFTTFLSFLQYIKHNDPVVQSPLPRQFKFGNNKFMVQAFQQLRLPHREFGRVHETTMYRSILSQVLVLVNEERRVISFFFSGGKYPLYLVWLYYWDFWYTGRQWWYWRMTHVFFCSGKRCGREGEVELRPISSSRLQKTAGWISWV